MIIIGDKIKLIQKISNFDKIGDIFEVTGVDGGVISFTCDYGAGCMSYNEFEKYFEKIEVINECSLNNITNLLDVIIHSVEKVHIDAIGEIPNIDGEFDIGIDLIATPNSKINIETTTAGIRKTYENMTIDFGYPNVSLKVKER